MGGVDLHDNGIANYRSRVLGKKWWWPLFRNSLDSIVVNAWKLYNIANNTKMAQLDFKSYIALRLIKSTRVHVQRHIPQPLVEVRCDNYGHSIITTMKQELEEGVEFVIVTQYIFAKDVRYIYMYLVSHNII